MKEGFENKFSEIQTDMVSICVEYVKQKADVLYIYASNECSVISCDYFYRIDGKMFERHQLPQGYDVSIQRQAACMDVLIEDMKKLEACCKEYEAAVPTEIKITYDLKNNSLNAAFQYDNIYSDTNLDADDMAEKWFKKLNK